MRRALTLWSALLLLAAFVSQGHAESLAAKKTPKAIRDALAGIHELKATPPQQPDTAVEPSIAVNPENPLNVVIGFQAGRVDSGCAQTLGYGVTFDGGKSWKWGALPGVSEATGGTYPLASDPVVAFGPDDTVYFNSLLCEAATNDLGFNVSTDGGKTWGETTVVPTERTFPMDDKNWIIVDNGTGMGHHPGRLYMVWDQVAPVVAMYSDDQAQTWQGPFAIYPGQGIGSFPLVMPNGDLAVVFATLAYPLPALHRDAKGFQGERIAGLNELVISTAPGAGLLPTGAPLVFTPATTVADDLGVDTIRQRAGENVPTAAVDPNNGTIYVAWQDARYREDTSNDIVIASSPDGGATWSSVERVNPGKPNDYVDRFTPALTVTGDGTLGIFYRVQYLAVSPDKYSPFVDTFYQQSADGRSWSAPLKVNRTIRSDVRFAAFSRSSAFYGDYNQAVSTGSWIYYVRCESYALSPKEPATFPPKVHHQRAWVALVDVDGDGKR